MITRLRRVVQQLRRQCPWDRRQTLASMQANVIEEAYELVEAIRKRDYEQIQEEIGDLFFLALFLVQILEDRGKGSLAGVVDGITEKLIKRHPHVFGSTKVRGSEEVLRNWHRIKEQEKGRSVLDGVPRSLPALQRAESVQQRARRVGFDWQESGDVLDKVIEEVRELKAELSSDRRVRSKIREELGDLLFALVNAARHLEVDAEAALQQATDKFILRFRQLENEFARRGKRVADCGLEELDREWEHLKAKARPSSSRRKRPGATGREEQR
ncbi:MAG: nucleoside triphosphate pyrophosphohydrolase [candidate division WOR-3 bacterium]